MFKQVVYNTYIGKSSINIVKDKVYVDPTTKIGDIAYPCIILDKNRDTLTWPDYYLMGFYDKGTEDYPEKLFQCLKPWNKILHHMYITGIPKNVPSLNPFRLKDCIWSSYYEDKFHGFLFQIVKSNTILKLKSEDETIS